MSDIFVVPHSAGDGYIEPRERWLTCSECGEVLWAWQEFYDEAPEYTTDDFQEHLDYHERKDLMQGLNKLASDIHEANVEKGFWDDHRPLTETTMLIVTELAEAVEEERAGRSELWFQPDGKPEGVDIELIDALIRLLDLLGSRDTDIEFLLSEKLSYNAGRPYKHGRSY